MELFQSPLREPWSSLSSKKPGLELLEKNYRPVSNLSYISKLVEFVMTAQLVTHIERHGMMEAHQSAYHSSYSIETALLKVKIDIIQALDNQEVACLILLDLSVVFDTIDPDILLNRLKSRFVVTEVVLKWLVSYLKDRSQVVEIGVSLSGGSRLEFAKMRLGRLCLGSDIVHHSYSSHWWYMQKASGCIPPLCRWHPNLPIIQAQHTIL